MQEMLGSHTKINRVDIDALYASFESYSVFSIFDDELKLLLKIVQLVHRKVLKMMQVILIPPRKAMMDWPMHQKVLKSMEERKIRPPVSAIVQKMIGNVL